MKNLLRRAFLCIATLTAPYVSAQDVCCYDYSPCCEKSFDGFYIGGNVAVFSHIAFRSDFDGFITDSSGWTTVTTSFAGGVQGGWDWQCGNHVLGIVGDWSAVGVKNYLNDTNREAQQSGFISTRLDWYSTIRGRAGLVVCDTLLYLTAGGAVANFKSKWSDSQTLFSRNRARWGWTGGIGAEYLYSCHFSVGTDLLFMIFADDKQTHGDPINFTFGHADACWTARFSLNYRL